MTTLTYTPPTSEPAILRAGDVWTWTKSFADFPVSEGWALSYAIQGIGAVTWDSSWVSNDGTTYTVKIPAATTAAVGSGRYLWAAYVTLSGDRYTADEGAFYVEPNLATATAGSQQAHAEKMVALIQAELENRFTGRATVQKYTVHGRSIELIPTTELRQLLGFYRAELQRLSRPTQLGQKVVTRFVPVRGGWTGV